MLPWQVVILGRGLQLNLDASVLSISWEVLMCDVPAASEAASWDEDSIHNCKPFDKALDVYVNEYVHFQSTVLPPLWKCA